MNFFFFFFSSSLNFTFSSLSLSPGAETHGGVDGCIVIWRGAGRGGKWVNYLHENSWQFWWPASGGREERGSSILSFELMSNRKEGYFTTELILSSLSLFGDQWNHLWLYPIHQVIHLASVRVSWLPGPFFSYFWWLFFLQYFTWTFLLFLFTLSSGEERTYAIKWLGQVKANQGGQLYPRQRSLDMQELEKHTFSLSFRVGQSVNGSTTCHFGGKWQNEKVTIQLMHK